MPPRRKDQFDAAPRPDLVEEMQQMRFHGGDADRWRRARRARYRLATAIFVVLALPFALTVTASVQVVGVYLVFASLIVPALVAGGQPVRGYSIPPP